MRTTNAEIIAEKILPGSDTQGDLRMGIFIDRAEGRCVAMILNTKENRYAFMTDGEHAIGDGDDFDSVMEAVNAACEDIQRWAKENP